MRFSAPRSTSPSPERRKLKYGVPSDELEDSESSQSDAESAHSSASSDSIWYKSESEVPPPPPRPSRPKRSTAEQYYIEDTIASIRLRVNHHDPYEEWEKEIKQESFRLARTEQSLSKVERHKKQSQAHKAEANKRSVVQEKQMQAIQDHLAALNIRRQVGEKAMVEAWKERNKKLWDGIEAVIKSEEEKVRIKLEAERKKREEEERKRQEEEERRRQEEEKKRKEEEERMRQEQEEAEAKRRREEAERIRREREQAEAKLRETLGITTATQDWCSARDMLRLLKAGPMVTVKANQNLKSIWSAGRRAIIPKIGQLTEDPQNILRIYEEIVVILRPKTPHHQTVYFALLSNLAKAIFMQAEIEVTAEKRSAIPLAQLAVRLLVGIEGFAKIFWTKLCQRAGGWPVPFTIPSADSDGSTFTAEQRKKAMGYREEDTSVGDYLARISGIMRIYFLIMGHNLTQPTEEPLHLAYRQSRYWTYFARMLMDHQLMEDPVAPNVLHVALDVGGLEARDIWGQQWIKLLERLYECTTTGIPGTNGRLLGGSSPEGTSARVRVQIEIERILSAP
ncbi:uncharacterized protein FIBRA_06953 [Fibroporia radiculosa]|uniref:mRNA export factor GLE1 n=1 Tax=Fibroporia radiculosa TaxID=599839 RepID=J4GCZ9_9APHY|nr:uncharacterized protein FIBRA_06953 [Fibroporia radiculosa]CCM04763.1 predicted protein [Fibroporia radiculosa]